MVSRWWMVCAVCSAPSLSTSAPSEPPPPSDSANQLLFQQEDFAYRSVITELRKLLVDKEAVASFRRSIRRAKSAKSLLELNYGSGKNIFLKSFRRAGTPATDSYVDVTPDVYPVREDILYAATHGGTLVAIHEWLEEYLAYGSNGQILKVGTAIRYIAGKEGSHIINPVGDEREDIGIAFFSQEPTLEEIQNTDFNRTNPWRHFVIDAGMRLLAATYASGERVIEHTINVPETSNTYRPIRMQKRRR